MKKLFTIFTLGLVLLLPSLHKIVAKPRAMVDNTVTKFNTDRLCLAKEPCKEEFKNAFECRCPDQSYCASPGRYYNAFCTIVESGYIWTQNFYKTSS